MQVCASCQSLTIWSPTLTCDLDCRPWQRNVYNICHFVWKLYTDTQTRTGPCILPETLKMQPRCAFVLGFLSQNMTKVTTTDLQQIDPVTRRVHWSRGSASRPEFILIGCSKLEHTVGARLVLNTCNPVRLFTLEFANSSSVEFSSCAVNTPLLSVDVDAQTNTGRYFLSGPLNCAWQWLLWHSVHPVTRDALQLCNRVSNNVYVYRSNDRWLFPFSVCALFVGWSEGHVL